MTPGRESLILLAYEPEVSQLKGSKKSFTVLGIFRYVLELLYLKSITPNVWIPRRLVS